MVTFSKFHVNILAWILLLILLYPSQMRSLGAHPLGPAEQPLPIEIASLPILISVNIIDVSRFINLHTEKVSRVSMFSMELSFGYKVSFVCTSQFNTLNEYRKRVFLKSALRKKFSGVLSQIIDDVSCIRKPIVIFSVQENSSRLKSTRRIFISHQLL